MSKKTATTTTTPDQQTSAQLRNSRKALAAGLDEATWSLMTAGQKASATKRATVVEGSDGHFRAAARAAETFRRNRPVAVQATA